MANEPIPVEFTPEFKRSLRQLAKRYRHIHDDIEPIIEEIARGGKPGDRISGVKTEVFKVRAANSDARKGKSGGYRLIYQIQSKMVVLVTIYSKSDQADVAAAEIRRIIADHDRSTDATDEANGDT